MSIDKHYIELRLHYDNKTTKNESIQIEQLFNEKDFTSNSLTENNTKIIVIKGGPGCGKSTMMTKFSYEWAKKINSEYLYLFRINLKKLQ